MLEEFLILHSIETPREQGQKSIAHKLHLTFDVNGLETAEQIARLRLMIQIDHVYLLAEQTSQMLQRRRLAHARFAAQEHRLVTFDAARDLLEQAQR